MKSYLPKMEDFLKNHELQNYIEPSLYMKFNKILEQVV